MAKTETNEGWLKLYRKTPDTAIWATKDPYDRRSAWIDLLLSANYTAAELVIKNDVLHIQRGQLFTSVRHLSARWSWSKDRVLSFLRQLDRLEMINRDSTHSGTLITIVNYDKYQGTPDTK